MGREAAPPPRGVLRRSRPEGSLEHRRILPAVGLRPLIAHLWWVAWDLRAPFQAETLPHPTAHLIFGTKYRRAVVAGPQSKRFQDRLRGRGHVFGVKLRPGMLSLLSAEPVSAYKDQVRPLRELLGNTEARALEAAVKTATNLEAKAQAVEDWLSARAPRPESALLKLRDLVEAIEHERDLLRVSDLVERSGVDARSLERAFRRCIGHSPKWVIRRYRLIEAAELLAKPGPPLNLSRLAQDLGYYDQSHFSRDFRGLVGISASALQRATARSVGPGASEREHSGPDRRRS